MLIKTEGFDLEFRAEHPPPQAALEELVRWFNDECLSDSFAAIGAGGTVVTLERGTTATARLAPKCG